MATPFRAFAPTPPGTPTSPRVGRLFAERTTATLDELEDQIAQMAPETGPATFRVPQPSATVRTRPIWPFVLGGITVLGLTAAAVYLVKRPRRKR